jgi:hypothetical protein
MLQLGWLGPCPQILRVSKVKNSSLLGLVVNDEGKKFYSFDTWSVNQRVDKTTPTHFEIHSKEKIFTSKVSEFLFREKASVFDSNDRFFKKLVCLLIMTDFELKKLLQSFLC